MRKEVLLTIGTQVVTTATGAASGILLARVLAPEGRGALAALRLWPGLLLTLGGLGIPHTIAYFVGVRPDKSGKVLGTALPLAGIQTLLIVLVGFLVVPLALGDEYRDAIPLSLVYLSTVPMSLAAGISLGMLQGSLEMERYNALRVIQSALHLSGVGVLWLVGLDDLYWVVALLMVNSLVAACVGIWLAWRKVASSVDWDSDLAKQMVSYGVRTQLSNVVESLNLRLDQLVMSLFLAPASLGLYVVALSFSKLLRPVSHAIAIVALPAVARSERAQAVRQLGILFRSNLLVSLLLCGGLVIILPPLLPLLVGQAYVEAVVPAQVLALSAVFVGMNDVLSEALRGLDRPGVPAVGQGISLVLTVILLWVLLPLMGVLGAALTSLVAYVVTFVYQLYILQRSMQFGWKDMLPNKQDCRRLWRAAYALLPHNSRVD